MSFDEQPDGDLHGECAAEIHRLEQQRDELLAALNLHLPYVDQNNKTARGKSLAAIRAAIAKVQK